MDNAIKKLYDEMNAADVVFHKAVVKQFGKKRAGDMRYRSTKHNNVTKATAVVFWEAANRYCAAIEAARKAA